MLDCFLQCWILRSRILHGDVLLDPGGSWGICKARGLLRGGCRTLNHGRLLYLVLVLSSCLLFRFGLWWSWSSLLLRLRTDNLLNKSDTITTTYCTKWPPVPNRIPPVVYRRQIDSKRYFWSHFLEGIDQRFSFGVIKITKAYTYINFRICITQNHDLL